MWWIDVLAHLQFEEGSAPNAYVFALVEQLWILKESLKRFKTSAWVFSWWHVHLDMTFSCLNLQFCSLSTVRREFTPMHYVASLPFHDLILSAIEEHKDGDSQSRAWNDLEPLMDYLKVNLNYSHLEAVNVSIFFFYFCIVGICIVFLIFLKAMVLIVTAFLSRRVFHADPLFLFRSVIFYHYYFTLLLFTCLD